MKIEKLFSFIDSLIPAESLKDIRSDDLSRLRNYILVVLVTTPFYLSYTITYLIAGAYPLFYLLGSTLIGVLFSFAIFMVQSNFTWAASIYNLSAVITMFGTPYFSDGLNSATCLWYSIILLFITTFSGYKVLILWLFGLLINSLILLKPEILGLQVINVQSPELDKINNIVGVMGSSVVLFITLSFYLAIHKKTKDKLINLNNLANDKVKENQNLLRLVSHDINNSLTVIITGMTLLKLKGDKPEQRSNLEDRVTRAANKILDIINHVKEQQAIISGKKEINLTKVNLTEILNHSIHFLNEKFQSKNIKIDFINSSQNYFIISEPISLENVVINNLITNAIKFSNSGGTIHFSISEFEEHISFQIKDHGIGMPQDILNNLFSFDAKTSRTGTGGEAGTGFGMPLMKTYVELYGGQVKVFTRTIDDFPNDSGTTFQLDFKKPAIQRT